MNNLRFLSQLLALFGKHSVLILRIRMNLDFRHRGNRNPSANINDEDSRINSNTQNTTNSHNPRQPEFNHNERPNTSNHFNRRHSNATDYVRQPTNNEYPHNRHSDSNDTNRPITTDRYHNGRPFSRPRGRGGHAAGGHS